jgi:hypothetical protein
MRFPFPLARPFGPLLLGILVSTVGAEVTGVVRTVQGKAVPGAFVRMVDASDSTREATAFTDDLGRYAIKLPDAGPSGLRWNGPGNSGADAGLFPPNRTDGHYDFYDLKGRRSDWGGSLWSRPTDYARSGDRQASPAGRAKRAAPRNFHITVYGKGILPLRSRDQALADPAARDFSLPATVLWDSNRAILRDDLAACAERFTARKQGRVAFLGGSITYNPGWRDSVQNFLKRRFPQTAFDFINAGIPSVGSDMHGFRMRRDVLDLRASASDKGQVDLLFIESAVNDTTNGVGSLVRTRAYEGMVRQALRRNPGMDIVYLYFADPSFYPSVKAGKPISLVADYEKSAWQYGVSSLNLAQFVAERYTWQEFGGDVHPGPLGQGLYYRGIAKLLEAAWDAPGAAAASPPTHHVPARMQDSLCFQQGHADSISRAVIVSGWKRIANWIPSQGGTRPGFVNVPVLESTTPGDTLRFAFTGTAVGIVIAAGYDVGMLEFAIDGKPMGTRDQFTPWSSGLHIPWTLLFAADLPMKAHELRLVNAAGKNAGSQGHASRIIRFLVNGPD